MSFPFRNLFRQQQRWERRLQLHDGRARYNQNDGDTVSCSTISGDDDLTQRTRNSSSNSHGESVAERQSDDSFDDITLVTLPEDNDHVCLLFAGLEDEHQQDMELRRLPLSLAFLDQSSSTHKPSPLPPMVVTGASDEKQSRNTTQKPSKTTVRSLGERIDPLDDDVPKSTYMHTEHSQSLPAKTQSSDEHSMKSEREQDLEFSKMDAAMGMVGNRQRCSTTGSIANPSSTCSVDSLQERPPIGLYLYGDEETLTGYECLIRKQLEFFEPREASPDPDGGSTPTMMVGLRCRHCAHMGSQSGSGMVYPVRPDHLAETAHRLVKGHLLKTCPYVSEPLRKEIRRLMHGGNNGGQRQRSNPWQQHPGESTAEDGNEVVPQETEVLPPQPRKIRLYPRYWIEAAMECGIVVSQSTNALRWSSSFQTNPFGQRKLHRRYYNYQIDQSNFSRRRHDSDPLPP